MSEPTEYSPTDAHEGHDFDPAPSRWQERGLGVLLLLVAVPFLFRWGQGEIAKWHLAAARDAQYQGDRAGALVSANRAAKWDPDSPLIQSTQASMLLSIGDAESAAKLADQVLVQHRQEYEQRASKINHLRLAGSLNQSAYCHALTSMNLESALTDINEAIAIRESLPLPKDDGYASMLDTRGYLRYLVAKKRRDASSVPGTEHDDKAAQEENEDEADESADEDDQPATKEEQYQQLIADGLTDLETAVAIFKQALKVEQAGIENDARMVIDHAPLKFRRRSLDESMSVLLHHRGLLYQAVGKVAAAERDIDRAKQLGYDPENGVW